MNEELIETDFGTMIIAIGFQLMVIQMQLIEKLNGCVRMCFIIPFCFYFILCEKNTENILVNASNCVVLKRCVCFKNICSKQK